VFVQWFFAFVPQFQLNWFSAFSKVVLVVLGFLEIVQNCTGSAKSRTIVVSEKGYLKAFKGSQFLGLHI